jgi:hypothetical protein
VTYGVIFLLEAAAELVRIMQIASPVSTLAALEAIRRALEGDPRESGHELSEGLHYIDHEPLRAFYEISDDGMTVEVTDFRVL